MRRPLLPPARAALVLLGALALVPPAAGAQTAPATGAGVVYQAYRFSDPGATNLRSISLLTVPLGARARLGGRLGLEVTGAYARGWLERADGSGTAISGLTDTQLRVRFPVSGDRLVVGALVVLPTGMETPDREQVEVAGAIASDLLPFRISNWGSGGGAGVSATAAHSFGSTGIGFGASYLVSREFEPLADADLASYRPGNQLALQAAADRNFGTSGKASVRVVYQHQDDDLLRGSNLFRSGDRLQVIGTYAFRVARRSSGIAYLGGQRRERGTALLELSGDAPSQTLLLLGGGLRLPFGAIVTSPSADLRLLRSEDGVGQGWLGGFGAGAELPVGPLTATPHLRARIGRVLVRQGLESNVLGVEAGMEVRF